MASIYDSGPVIVLRIVAATCRVIVRLHATKCRRLVRLISLASLCCGCRGPELTSDIVEAFDREALAVLKMASATAPEAPLRARAVAALAFAAQPAARPWIRQGLFDSSPEVRFCALMTMHRLKDRSSLAPYLRLLADQSPLVRAGAMACLAAMGHVQHQVSLRRIVQASTDLGPPAAVQTLLLEMCDFLTLPELRDKLEPADEQHSALSQAARACLIKRGDSPATAQTILLARLDDPLHHVRAIEMLALSADPNMLYILAERLEKCPSLEGRLAAAHALGLLGSQEGLDLATQCLEYEQPDLEDRSARVRASACDACGAIGDPSNLAVIGEMTSVDKDLAVRIACASATLRLTAAWKADFE